MWKLDGEWNVGSGHLFLQMLTNHIGGREASDCDEQGDAVNTM